MSGADRREFHSNRRQSALSGGAACMGPLLEEASRPEAVASGHDAAKKSDDKSFLCDMSFQCERYTDEKEEEKQN